MTNELAIRILTGDVLGTAEQTQEAVKMAVKALSQPEPQWIPCSERLPEEEIIYLVTYSNGIVGTCSWHKDTKCNRGFDGILNGILDDGRIVVYSVVAWMPLPEPYKGERDDPDRH